MAPAEPAPTMMVSYLLGILGVPWVVLRAGDYMRIFVDIAAQMRRMLMNAK